MKGWPKNESNRLNRSNVVETKSKTTIDPRSIDNKSAFTLYFFLQNEYLNVRP